MRIKIFISTLILALSPLVARAAVLHLNGPEEKAMQLETQFEVTVTVDTEQETLNAFSGAISFPNESIALQAVRDGDSIISLWIEQPHEVPLTANMHSIIFSGTVPGGFKGTGKLFSLIFQAVGENADIKLTAGELISLKHDGLGTAVATTSKPLELSTSPRIDTSVSPEVRAEMLTDTTPPRPFEAHIIQNASIFNNQWAAVFSTTDPESGVQHYEIQESDSRLPRASGWNIVTSPHRLVDQERKSWVHIKAVNRVGLATITTITPSQIPAPPMQTITVAAVAKTAAISILTIMLLFLLRKRVLRHKSETIQKHN